MKIETIKTLNGANIYSHQPVMLMRLDLEDLSGSESREVAGFNEHLLEALPDLDKHFCTLGKPGGFVERLHKGTHFNHVVEHIAIEMLTQAGFGTREKKTAAAMKKTTQKP